MSTGEYQAGVVFWNTDKCYRLVLSSSAQGVFCLDLEGRISLCNPVAAQGLGYQMPEQLIGKDMHDTIQHSLMGAKPFPRTESRILKSLNAASASSASDEVFWRANGKNFPVEYWCRPLREAGEVIGCVVSFVDITERRRTQLALYKLTKRMNLALKASKVGTWSWNLLTDRVILDEFAAPLFGLEKASFAGTPEDIFLRLHADDRERVRAELDGTLEQGAEYDTQFRVAKADNDIRVIALRGEMYREKDGKAAQITGVVWDVTEAHSLTEQLTHQASHDPLTDLVNRREFERRLEKILENIQEDRNEHALCYMDLDQFKVINDTCGHIAGDELLKQVADLLRVQVRRNDTLARLGGDEFGLLMEDCTLKQARRVTDKLRAAIEEYRFEWEGKSFQVRVSIGLVPIDHSSESMTSVMSAADAACYAAKDAGRNRVHEYHEEDTVMLRRHDEMQWVVRIDRALEESRFELDYQPIVPILDTDDDGDHFELLVRLLDESGERVAPATFLKTAEQFNLTPKIDRWVIQRAFEWLKSDPDRLQRLSMCAINLSGLSLADEGFAEFVMTQFGDKSIPPEKICFEITETAAIANLRNAINFINELKRLGCVFALDDFGSGLSSFAYLKNLPVDLLKIDGQFVRDMHLDPINLAMVKSINDIGHVMGKKTIAEFVENDDIQSRLRELGVDYAQGFGISKPKSILTY